MARDYKNSSTKKAKGRDKPLGSWLSFLSGLALGLLVAFVIYIWRDDVPDVNGEGVLSKAEEIIFEKGPENTEFSDIEIDDRPTTTFDFFTTLPESEVKVPDWQLERFDNSAEEGLDDGTYAIQVGSFKELKDADRAKAQLALNGMHAKINRAVINGQEVWFRVHLGPFRQAEVQAMRRKLIESKRDFIVLKINNS